MANNLLTGLYAAWLMNEDGAVNRADVGPNSLPLIITGTLNGVTGKKGLAIDMQNNPANVLQRVDDGNFEFGDTSFSMAAWVRGTGTPNDPYIGKRNRTADQASFLLEHRATNDRLRFLCSDDGTNPSETIVESTAATPDAPTWSLVSGGFDKDSGEIWCQLGGQARVTAAHTGGMFDGTAALTVGWYDPGIVAEVVGSQDQDETYVWNRYLTVADVNTMFAGGIGLFFSSFDSGDVGEFDVREPFVVIELEQDQCRLLYGESPCTAALGTTGTRKCYNTRSTCQDRENYDSKPDVSDSEAVRQDVSAAGAVEASFDVSTEEALPSDVVLSRDGTKLYIVGQGADQVRQYPLSTPWDISSAGAVEASFSVSGEDTAPQGLFFKTDGTKLYVVGGSSDSVHQYPLTTAWDISTAGAVEETFSVAGEATAPTGLFFKTDGTKLYVVGDSSDKVHQYPLTTAWDISTAGTVEESFDVSGEQTSPQGIFFTSQGTKLYIIGGQSFQPNDKVHQYALATPWDLSTAGAVEASFDVSADFTVPTGIYFKTDGTKLYIVGLTSGVEFVRQYPVVGVVPGIARDATRTRDISTVGSAEASFSVAGEEIVPGGLFFKPDGTKLYVCGSDSDEAHQYPLSTPWDVSSAGSVEASFSDPSGMVNLVALFFKPDGTKLFVMGNVSSVLQIQEHPVSTAWDLSTVGSRDAIHTVFAEDTNPQGMFFKSDGTKVYMVGIASDEVHQYPISSEWDLSTVGAVEASFSVATEDGTPSGIFFRSDGEKLYMVGATTDNVYQYPLSTAWDVSSAGGDEASFDVSGEDTVPSDLFFKVDGRKLYVVGQSSDEVHQYPIPLIEGEIQGATHVRSSPTGFGQALSFDGIDDSVEVADALDTYGFVGTASFTIEFLLTPSSIPNNFARLFDQEFTDGGGDQGWRILLRQSDTKLVFERLRDGAVDSVSAAVSLLDARFWSAVYDGTDLILYEEGTERARSASSKLLLTSGEPLFIGNTFVGETSEPYHGLLDDIRIWTTARSEAQIRERMVLPLSGLEAGLASYFPLDDSPPAIATRTIRFTKPQTSAPRDLYLLPLLVDVDTASTRINPGGGSRDRGVLGDRASVDIGFKDAPGSGRVVDKYRTERISGTAQTDEGGYEPLERGTFWAKWRARNLFFQNRRVRILEGYVGENLRDMQRREYFVDQLRGPDADGRTVIRAKDVLKLADDERAQAPRATPGELTAALTAGATTNFQATGALIADYPDEPGLVRIGSEVIGYVTRTQATVDNVQFNTLTRGARGSAAEAHDAEDRVQRCLEFVSVLPWKLAEDLLVNFGNVPAEFIPITDWDAEGEVWLVQFTLSAVITEPTSVTVLLSEITQQAQFFIWWDEHTQTIKLKALRPPTEDTVVLDEVSHLIEGASVLKEHPDQRLSQVWVFFSQKDPTKRLDEEANFARVRIRADLEAESAEQYGESRIRKIFSRWLETEGQVSQMTKRTLDRYRDNPRTLKVRADAKDRAALRVGEVADILMRTVLDDRGLEVSTRWQIIAAREDPPGEAVALELLEFEFTGRFAFYMEATAPIFDLASDQEKKSGAWYADDDGKFSDGTDGFQYQ